MNIKALCSLAFICLSLVGCARVPLAPHQASLENLELLRSSNAAPVNVGEFALAKGKESGIDKSVSARATTLYSPNADSFAQFLKEALTTELRAAGKYDKNSTTVVRGWLTDNKLDASGIAVGNASLGAKFAINQGEQLVYEKELKAQAEWESSFVGAIAIPAAVNQYTALFKKLLAQLFADEEFKQAIRAKSQ